MYKITKQLFLLVMLAVFSLPAGANKDSKINLPRGTVEGYLDNGLHYIIMPNALPRHGIEMRLVMKVGSLQEKTSRKVVPTFWSTCLSREPSTFHRMHG